MSFILRRIINVISTDMKMMVLEPGLQGGGEDLGVRASLEKAHSIYGAAHPEEQGWMHSWQALKPHLPSAIKGKKTEHDSSRKGISHPCLQQRRGILHATLSCAAL